MKPLWFIEKQPLSLLLTIEELLRYLLETDKDVHEVDHHKDG